MAPCSDSTSFASSAENGTGSAEVAYTDPKDNFLYNRSSSINPTGIVLNDSLRVLLKNKSSKRDIPIGQEGKLWLGKIDDLKILLKQEKQEEIFKLKLKKKQMASSELLGVPS